MSLDSFVKITAVPELFERLQADAEQFRGDLERLQRFVELAMAKQVVAPAPAPNPKPAVVVPLEMESSARKCLEDKADAAAAQMISGFDSWKQKRQTTGTSLAHVLRIAREASLDFECPQTMRAILRALELMGAAAREATSHG